MKLNPYDVLGVPRGSDFDTVKKAYKKMLIYTHPDKTGDAQSFMLVHKAFNYIQSMHKETKSFENAPKTKVSYNDNVEKPKNIFNDTNFDSNKFNKFFENNKITGIDPYNKGYSNMMHSSSKNREDVADLNKHKVKTVKRGVVIYKEPEPMNQLYTSNYELLGTTDIKDFSCNIGGTDYMKAYMNPEEKIDTVRKYKNIREYQTQRENQTFDLSQEEKEYEKSKEMNLRKLEQLRLQKMKSNDNHIYERYNYLNNNICYKY